MSSNKAIAVHAVVLVIIIGFLLFFTIAGFLTWLKINEDETTNIACAVKQYSFCIKWWKENKFSSTFSDKEGWFSDDCSKPSTEQCKALLRTT